jgi:O-antigen ligase
MRFRLAAQYLLAGLCSLIAVLAWPAAKGRFSATYTILGLCCLTAAWTRSGWLIPSTVFGVIVGMFVLDPSVKGGDAESQMWETVSYIILGSVGGLVFGLTLDGLARLPPADRSQDSGTREQTTLGHSTAAPGELSTLAASEPEEQVGQEQAPDE